ncbi:MAG TPA: hypothetical protein VGP27_17860 [Mycobacterium sp.]|nr:hypothetical protein [Mycobacterium sp.]
MTDRGNRLLRWSGTHNESALAAWAVIMLLRTIGFGPNRLLIRYSTTPTPNFAIAHHLRR